MGGPLRGEAHFFFHGKEWAYEEEMGLPRRERKWVSPPTVGQAIGSKEGRAASRASLLLSGELKQIRISHDNNKTTIGEAPVNTKRQKQC